MQNYPVGKELIVYYVWVILNGITSVNSLVIFTGLDKQNIWA